MSQPRTGSPSQPQKEEGQATGFQLAVVGQMLLIALPAFGIALWIFLEHPVLSVMVLLLGFVGCIWVRASAYRRFRCPECGLLIPQRLKGQRYDGIAFYCQKCRVDGSVPTTSRDVNALNTLQRVFQSPP